MYGKIIKAEEVAERAPQLRINTTKLVFTNGCFDLLHPGHIEYLIAARSLGDKLIVGVNDNTSVSRLKGKSRPINDLHFRMTMLSALHCVDHVVPFEEDTPLELIKLIKPKVLVKGGDYKKENIVGANLVEQSGGEVAIIPFKEGYSTTSLIDRIRNSH